MPQSVVIPMNRMSYFKTVTQLPPGQTDKLLPLSLSVPELTPIYFFPYQSAK